ncbi:MAG: hypothetical protein QGG80_09065 [Candidatus Krumholzibacteria bacterium]|nr:hypothetical protein [Candidatus Krumholzibacteria bacterium]
MFALKSLDSAGSLTSPVESLLLEGPGALEVLVVSALVVRAEGWLPAGIL